MHLLDEDPALDGDALLARVGVARGPEGARVRLQLVVGRRAQVDVPPTVGGPPAAVADEREVAALEVGAVLPEAVQDAAVAVVVARGGVLRVVVRDRGGLRRLGRGLATEARPAAVVVRGLPALGDADRPERGALDRAGRQAGAEEGRVHELGEGGVAVPVAGVEAVEGGGPARRGEQRLQVRALAPLREGAQVDRGRRVHVHDLAPLDGAAHVRVEPLQDGEGELLLALPAHQAVRGLGAARVHEAPDEGPGRELGPGDAAVAVQVRGRERRTVRVLQEQHPQGLAAPQPPAHRRGVLQQAPHRRLVGDEVGGVLRRRAGADAAGGQGREELLRELGAVGLGGGARREPLGDLGNRPEAARGDEGRGPGEEQVLVVGPLGLRIAAGRVGRRPRRRPAARRVHDVGHPADVERLEVGQRREVAEVGQLAGQVGAGQGERGQLLELGQVRHRAAQRRVREVQAL